MHKPKFLDVDKILEKLPEGNLFKDTEYIRALTEDNEYGEKAHDFFGEEAMAVAKDLEMEFFYLSAPEDLGLFSFIKKQTT